MEIIARGVVKAIELVLTFDAEVWSITWLSLKVSGCATLVSLLLGIPFGIALASSRFPGRAAVAALVNTGMGLPPVVVGLFVSIFLWRSGPLGFLELIYSPSAMVMAQVIIAFPIVESWRPVGSDPADERQLISGREGFRVLRCGRRRPSRRPRDALPRRKDRGL